MTKLYVKKLMIIPTVNKVNTDLPCVNPKSLNLLFWWSYKKSGFNMANTSIII